MKNYETVFGLQKRHIVILIRQISNIKELK